MKKFCERLFFFSSRRRHTRWNCDWSSDVCSSDLMTPRAPSPNHCASPSQESSHHARSASCCQSIKMYELRSEERRVGKECRSRWSPAQQKKNDERRRAPTACIPMQSPALNEAVDP